ncbi:cytochrome p450 [Trifolium pratense]|uniref:Cytochrome p450 n=2 Tax=Trifolium pratense TaxID=57577 RepID=A0A2K3NFA8_TRIPR|nr:cytochrome p450 [Trifolium pratense]
MVSIASLKYGLFPKAEMNDYTLLSISNIGSSCEAMFADLDHFNVGAIRISFLFIALPAILAAYSGQVAYLRTYPADVSKVFYASILVFERACTVLTDWQMAQTAPKKSINGQQQPAVAKWVRLSLGRYKCNIDASFFSSGLNRVGIGTCIRDDQGRFVVAKTEWFSPVCDVEMDEAQGLLQAFKWVRDLQLEDVDFELDAQTVTKFHSKKDDVSEFGEVIKDCQCLHNTFFKNSKV